VESALREGGGEPGLKLIETMFWDAVEIRRWDLHMARMSRGAALLGWPWDAEAALATVDVLELVEQARVRLTMVADGRFEATLSPMPYPATRWTVIVAGERLSSSDPWLKVKSNRRGAYNRARAALPQGADEAILLNERGEVCDGTITTVFFDRGQGMRTPPLSSGLLPGVLRAELGCPEEVLMAEDLPKVRLWVGNALRGLIPAVLAG
jgi:4-amino-4-deoxychorismate lyase